MNKNDIAKALSVLTLASGTLVGTNVLASPRQEVAAVETISLPATNAYDAITPHGAQGECGEGSCGEAASTKGHGAQGECGEGSCGEAASTKGHGAQGECGEGSCG